MREYPDEAIIVYKCSKTATKYTRKYYNKNGIYDNSDAFRHCLWNALIKHDIGTSKAKKWTDAHESETPSGLDKDMDLFNNKVGRSIKTSGKIKTSDIAKKALTKVKTGKCRRLNSKKTKLIKTNKSGLKKKYR